MRLISDDERRARLAVRHALAPSARVDDPVAATRAMTVLHSTEPATVYLSLHARVDGLTVEDVDRALYDDRSLVKQLAMRRTLFVFPRELLPAAWGSASARVAAQLRTRLVKEVQAAGLADDGAAWLDAAEAAVLARLADGSALPAQTLREEVPELQGRIELAADKAYGGTFPIAPRVLGQLGVEALIVRGRNGGHWRISRPQWTSMRAWLGEEPVPLPGREGYAALVAAWLATFGPGTVRRRPVVARRHRRRRAARPGGRRSRGGGPRGRSDRLGAARRRRPHVVRRALGRPAARARPDRHGLEGARLLPRAARRGALRRQRQRRHHRLV